MKSLYQLFERWTEPFPSTDAATPPQGLIKFCLSFTKGFGLPLIIMGIISALVAIIEVSLFNYVGHLIDLLSRTDVQTFKQQHLDDVINIGLLMLIGVPILVAIHSLITHQSLLGNYPMSIRWYAHRYLLKQDLSFYQADFAGRIATKVMQTALAVRETIMKLLDVAVYAIVYMSAIIVVLASSDWRLMMPMLLWLIAYVCIQLYYIPKLKKVSMDQADARSVMTGRIVDTYSNIMTVKLFSYTQRETDYAKSAMDGFLVTVHKQMRLVTGLNFWVELVNYLLVFAIGAISIWLWLDNAISSGVIAAALALVLRLNGMAHWIMWEVSSLFENIGTVADGMQTLTKPLPQEPKTPKTLTVNGGQISFKDIRFGYDTNSKVIDGLNLSIAAGEKIGLVGRSGAGKSTLVNLLLGFYPLQHGSISIDDQDLIHVPKETLRQHIGMITQDTSLLHRSIRENILYGRPEASEQELIDAAKNAHAYEFIQELVDEQGNKGFDAQVGERGVKLSGGQRQRIAIARVLLKNAPILIMDEATSALDSEIEQAIGESLNQLMTDKTVIAIAHRLSTIAAMDKLIVLDKGQIVEFGSHQQLLAQDGIYASLWKRQSGGFIGED
ncbi:ABC transporter ATP-binding protein [Paraferrimonas sp. SM1919]|uniref:ABC transporter ATP-binding protein n=1 Tax=Paraferrimonas sp. SM1919 TaxID=2662263 RepID=UPI0013D6319F|nr:ABC transporter ATP-binding protein [Paraferrimonas sp. SM1919]